MNSIIKAFLTVSLTLGLLASCAQPNPHPMDMTTAVQSAKTAADHRALADHYEAVARDMDQKAADHKRLLAQFKKDPHDFPKAYQGGNFENHCERLIDIYQRAADENRQLAQMHRQMARAAQ